MEIMHKVKSIEEVLSKHRSDSKVYNIGLDGAFEPSRRNVMAMSVKDAKRKFAEYHGTVISPHIIARKHDSVSLNDHDYIW